MDITTKIYHLLSRIKNLRLRVQDTLIIGNGFTLPTLMRNSPEGLLEFVILEDSSFSMWSCREDEIFEVTSDFGRKSAKLIEPDQLRALENCIVRKNNICKPQSINVSWSAQKGYSSASSNKNGQSILSVSLRFDINLVKKIIDSFFKDDGQRLNYLELKFVILNNEQSFSEIQAYACSECESLVRFNNLFKSKNTSPVHKLNKYKPVTQSAKLTPLVSTISRQQKEEDKVEQRIRQIMKKNTSLKYIRYDNWKRHIESGKSLLPNEELFGKMLAKYSSEAKQYDSIKEVKNLAVKMAINLDENKSKRQLQEGVRHEILNSWILNTGKMALQTVTEKTKKKNMNLKGSKIYHLATNEINQAASKLDHIQETLRLKTRK